MPRPLKIAVLGSRGVPSSYSGVERVVESLYAALAERGHAITVYGRREHARNGPTTYRGMRVIGTRGIDSRSFGTASQVTTSAIHILREGGYDLVHTHALAAGLVVPLLARFGLPVVSTIHGVDWQRAKWRGLGARVLHRAERWIVRDADEMIVISRDLERYYRDSYDRVTCYIPNATDLTHDGHCDYEILAKFGLARGNYLLSVARLVPEKRFEDLISAYMDLESDKRLVIVGGSADTDDYVRALHATARGDSRIVFTGTQPREAVATFLRGAAVYVLPSELEGMPISLLEALEMGLPCVVSRLPVHEEILGPCSRYDLFFAPRDVAGLRASLRRALDDIPNQRNIAEEIQRHVRAKYTWPAIADQTENLYREVLAKRARPANDASAFEPPKRSQRSQ